MCTVCIFTYTYGQCSIIDKTKLSTFKLYPDKFDFISLLVFVERYHRNFKLFIRKIDRFYFTSITLGIIIFLPFFFTIFL